MATTVLEQLPTHVTEPSVTSAKPDEPRSSPSAMDMVDELLGLAGGLGFFFMAFLSAIPGLVPAVILVAGPLLLLLIPMLVLGTVGAVGALVWLSTRALYRVVANHGGRAG